MHYWFWPLMMVVFVVLMAGPEIRALSRPIQREPVKVKKTREDPPDYFVTFEFPDGAEKEILISIPHLYFQIDDTGILSYRETKNAKHHRQRRFESFEKDPID